MTMHFSLSVTLDANGRTVTVHIEEQDGRVQNDMRLSSDLLYERITELTNNIIRRHVNRLAPIIQELRKRPRNIE